MFIFFLLLQINKNFEVLKDILEGEMFMNNRVSIYLLSFWTHTQVFHTIIKIPKKI